MRDIVYDVAVSLDGYIAGPSGDVSDFPMDGAHVADYLVRLSEYCTVVMGRATYEFGYDFGLEPGARAYPHMDHHIFSGSGHVPPNVDVTVHAKDWSATLDQLRAELGGPIYLCGGGRFAGFVANAGHLTDVVFKRVPIVLGTGVPAFGGLNSPIAMSLIENKTYDNGVRLERYKVTGSARPI